MSLNTRTHRTGSRAIAGRGAAAMVAACVFGSGIAGAAELRPMQGGSIALGPLSGIVYYTVDGGAFRVVATLAPQSEGAPVRIVASLNVGESVTLSVPDFDGSSAQTVRLARDGDRLIVGDPDTRSLASR